MPAPYTKCKIITAGSTFTVPPDWNNADNTVHCLGAGGSNGALVRGGISGGYAAAVNMVLTPSSSVACQLGVWGGDGTVNGTSSTWVGSLTTLRAAGGYGNRLNTGGSIGDVTFAGGNPGTTSPGGGGAPGPSGVGAGGTGNNGGAANGGLVAGGVGGTAPVAGTSSQLWTDNSGTASNGTKAGPGSGGGGSVTAGKTGAAGGNYGAGQAVGPAAGGIATNGLIVLEWTPGAGQMKVRIGAAWVFKPVKVWNGSAWVAKPLKVWNGSAWVLS